MIYTVLIMVLFIASFVMGATLEGLSALLALSVLATLGGLLTAAVRSDGLQERLLAEHVLGIGKTLQLQQFMGAVIMQPTEVYEDHVQMPIYMADPKIKAITGAFTCQLGGRRVLILEHDPTEVLPETVEGLFA